MKSVDFWHPVHFFHPDGTPPTSDKPVISEYYDELVFVSPRQQFYEILTAPLKYLTFGMPSKAFKTWKTAITRTEGTTTTC